MEEFSDEYLDLKARGDLAYEELERLYEEMTKGSDDL